MARTFGRVLAAAVVMAIVLVPASAALAVDPPQAPAPIISEGFETAYPGYLDVSSYQIPGDPPTNAWWGRITGSKYSGSYGLWAAGQGGSWGSDYPIRTRGTATFAVPELADYYSSSLDFRYTMPSVGAWDWFITRWSTDASSPSPDWDVNYEPVSSGWTLESYDLASAGNGTNLSRDAGDVQFFFFDRTEPSGVTPTQGRGPTIDDVTIAGYKYGPVRNLDSIQVGAGDVDLTWDKPYGVVGSTTVDSRSVTYRVWRAPGSNPSPGSWTELTTTRIATTSWTDTTAVGGVNYTYLVQAWDTGTGTGYGEPRTAQQYVSPVLQVVVTADPTVVEPGESVQYRYDVRNLGVADVTSVTLVDDVYGTIDSWATITPGETKTQFLNTQVFDDVTNTATASGTYQGGSVSGMDSATVTVFLQPGITLTVNADKTAVEYGGKVTLTYKATNTGQAPLSNVKVTDGIVGTFTLTSSLAPGASAQTNKTVTLYETSTSSARVDASSSYGAASDTAPSVKITVAPPPLPTGVDRLAGTDRVDTAVKASQTAFTDPLTGEKAVVVATAWGWADALPASALAGSVNGPLLLVNPDSVPASVLAEMDRLGADKVYIVGGTGVVASSVGTQLANAGLAVERVAGTTRYGTARAVAAKVVEKEGRGGTVFVATGLNFPDALAASSLAARMKAPIVLTLAGALPSDTQVALRAVAPDEIVVCGGTGVVSAGVQQQLAGYAPKVTRQAGSTRYDTAKALVEWGEAKLTPGGPGGVWVATGTNYPDALAGGVLAGIGYEEWMPLMLTDPATLSPQVTSYIQANPSIGFAGVLGGTGAVSPAVGAQLAQLVQ